MTKESGDKKEYWGLRPGVWGTFAGVLLTVLTLTAGIWRAQDLRTNDLEKEVGLLKAAVVSMESDIADQEKSNASLHSHLSEIKAELRGLRVTLEHLATSRSDQNHQSHRVPYKPGPDQKAAS